MGKINFGRVLLGGLVAGVILNIGEWLLNGFVLAKQMEEQFFRKCGIPMPGGGAMVILISITFVLGIVIVLLYAMIRPRCGAGPKTAIVAGLMAWFLVFVCNNIIGAALGFIPMKMLAIGVAWELVEYLLATMVGAALYSEA